MANGHDSTKAPPPPPPPPNGPGVPGGEKPHDVYQPPQLRKILLLAGSGGAIGGFLGALLGCCLLHMH
jgi:hypothetical protein